MGLPANTYPTSSTELEHLEKEQSLGEAANVGCPRFETPNAIPGGPAAAIPATIPRGTAAAIPAAIPRGTTTAFTATTTGGTTTIETSTGKTRKRAGKT
jgi:hypothetical protein